MSDKDSGPALPSLQLTPGLGSVHQTLPSLGWSGSERGMALTDLASLHKWQRCQPISVLTLDRADRAVLRVAGKTLGLSV